MRALSKELSCLTLQIMNSRMAITLSMTDKMKRESYARSIIFGCRLTSRVVCRTGQHEAFHAPLWFKRAALRLSV